MTSGILKDVFEFLDEQGVTKRNPETGLCPVAIVDGHISHLGAETLAYWNGFDPDDMKDTSLEEIEALQQVKPL
jgi:hypothetical protein